MKKIDKNYFIILAICLFAVITTMRCGYLYGSTVDWFSQHIILPDYFRNLFYDTNNLFPSFAFNIGAGENIFNFSYYGLLSPILMISYLFPFISMHTYIVFTNIILYILFGMLTYKWLKCHFDNKYSLLLSIICVLSSSVLFHFHRHFMFVNYLPFLILGLIGIDKYIKSKKSLLITISVFMIILTSYYYSISSILVLIIYFIYRYLDENNFNFKDLIKQILKIMVPILIGVLISGILIVPTLFMLFSNRGLDSFSVLSLVIPNLNISAIVYDNYAVGLTAISVVSILMLFQSKNKSSKYLSIVLFIIISIPLIICLLNGMLYVRNKVFIPFLPLFVLLIGLFLKELFDKKIKLLIILSIVFYTSILFLIFGYHEIYYYVDVVLVCIFISIFYKTGKKIFLIIYIILSSLVCFYISNYIDSFVSISMYNNLNDKYKYNKISNIVNENKSYRFVNLYDSYYGVNKIYNINQLSTSIFSSLENKNYSSFYVDVFKNNLENRNNLMLSSTGNVLFNMYMGSKYIYSDYNLIGYKKIDDNIYINNDVLPIFYVRYNTLNEEVFNSINYPYNIDVLLNNVITKTSDNKEYKTNIKKIDLKYNYEKSNDLDIEYKDNKYYINVKKDLDMVLKLDEILNNKILLIDFKVNNQHDCSNNDSEIKINNINNVLTCSKDFYENDNYVFHYVISSDLDIDKLNISIKKGLYIIDNINTYILDYNDIKDITSNIDIATVNKDETKGDVIKLHVENKYDGYFVSTLPYDDGFSIYVDDEMVEYEKVNTSFVGFKINKGSHDIKIVYKTKYAKLGKIISLLGIILLVIYQIIERKTN